eukprot:2481724-Pyramimonas_sp.AAC.3
MEDVPDHENFICSGRQNEFQYCRDCRTYTQKPVKFRLPKGNYRLPKGNYCISCLYSKVLVWSTVAQI